MAISENTVNIFEFLKANYGKRFTNADVAAGVDRVGQGRSISGSLRGLVNKGLVDDEMTTFENDGKEKLIKTYSITDKGMESTLGQEEEKE